MFLNQNQNQNQNQILTQVPATLPATSLKLATLLAITCPKRVSSLSSLDLHHYKLLPEGLVFTLTVATKTTLLKLSLLDFQKTQNYAQSSVSIHICHPPHVFGTYLRPENPIICLFHTSNRVNQSPLHLWRVGFAHFLLKLE